MSQSQLSTQSYDFLVGGPGRGRRRSRSRSRSAERVVAPMLRQTYRRLRYPPIPRNMKGTVHKFTRMVSTNRFTNQTAGGVVTNYWGINNRSLDGISYGGTTPNVFGNSISIYFDLLGVHIDLYDSVGGIKVQTVYGLPSVAEFVALYEEFRIDWVQIDCYSSMENAFKAGSAADVPQNSAMLYYVKDYNDADCTTLTQMMQQEDVEIWQPGIGNQSSYNRRIRVKPKANFTVANASMVGAGTAKMPGLTWMTTEDSQTIPHYGVKMAANTFFPTGDATNQVSNYLAFNFTYHLSFRNVR